MFLFFRFPTIHFPDIQHLKGVGHLLMNAPAPKNENVLASSSSQLFQNNPLDNNGTSLENTNNSLQSERVAPRYLFFCISGNMCLRKISFFKHLIYKTTLYQIYK